MAVAKRKQSKIPRNYTLFLTKYRQNNVIYSNPRKIRWVQKPEFRVVPLVSIRLTQFLFFKVKNLQFLSTYGVFYNVWQSFYLSFFNYQYNKLSYSLIKSCVMQQPYYKILLKFAIWQVKNTQTLDPIFSIYYATQLPLLSAVSKKSFVGKKKIKISLITRNFFVFKRHNFKSSFKGCVDIFPLNGIIISKKPLCNLNTPRKDVNVLVNDVLTKMFHESSFCRARMVVFSTAAYLYNLAAMLVLKNYTSPRPLVSYNDYIAHSSTTALFDNIITLSSHSTRIFSLNFFQNWGFSAYSYITVLSMTRSINKTSWDQHDNFSNMKHENLLLIEVLTFFDWLKHRVYSVKFPENSINDTLRMLQSIDNAEYTYKLRKKKKPETTNLQSKTFFTQYATWFSSCYRASTK